MSEGKSKGEITKKKQKNHSPWKFLVTNIEMTSFNLFNHFLPVCKMLGWRYKHYLS